MNSMLHSRRTKVLATCAVVLAAGSVVVLIENADGTARATSTPSVTQSDYSALSTGASVDPPASLRPAALDATTDGSPANLPVADSMTTLTLGNANLNVKIARSTQGGVCVFVERRGAQGVGGSCASAALLGVGAKVELQEAGERTLAGVVPDGVTAVTVGFADGSSQTVPVVDNGWAIETAQASMTSATDTVGG